MSHRPRRRVAVAVVAAAALLAGCAPEVPEPDPEPAAATPPPVLDDERLDRILADIGSTLAAGDEARDPELLKPRVTGPALEVRAAEYRLTEALGQDGPAPLTTDTQFEAVAATDAFPRVVIAVSQVPEGSNFPLVLALVQAEPRAQYQLWGWAGLLPDAETPAFIHPDRGSAQLGPEAEGLVATPRDVVAAYAAELNDPDGQTAVTFAEDRFREFVSEETTALEEGVESAGEASTTAAAGDDGPLVLGTADGGAFVMGELALQTVIKKTVPGSELSVRGQLGALLEDPDTIPGSATFTREATVAFYVPPAGAEDGTVEPIGAGAVYTGAIRDDDDAPAET
ncbi:hypothetical protein MF406_13470 [Georgenia sp. TF02-10]|uniref:hypothetical protein n=1 Tax=Georgenia sp. TF02-10 TaxID=2917725 RepID=UPI001FA7BF4E|nr:hypothetical protein [Georgenia sp. TF02-10]UNX53965.1 hypothetical protein MF406_13470 [Georgenia sp. TF02-10]